MFLNYILTYLCLFYSKNIVSCRFVLLFIIFKSWKPKRKRPLSEPLLPFCFTFPGHSSVRLASANHIALSVSIVCAFAEHTMEMKERLKKNPFTCEIWASWVFTNATLMRGGLPADGCADILLGFCCFDLDTEMFQTTWRFTHRFKVSYTKRDSKIKSWFLFEVRWSS